MTRPLHQSARPVAGRKRRLDQAIVSRSPARILDPRIGHREPARIRDHAAERRGSSRFGTAEIDLILLGAGPPGEVACHGAQAAPSRGGRLTHAETAVAAGLMQSRARFDKPCHATLPNQLLERLARSRVDVERDARSDPPGLLGSAIRGSSAERSSSHQCRIPHWPRRRAGANPPLGPVPQDTGASLDPKERSS